MKDHRGHRRASLRESLGKVTFKSDHPDWPFRGPSAVEEFLHGIDATGLDLAAYHGHWQTTSGVHPAAGCTIEFKNLLEIMRHLLLHDQVNVGTLAGAELIARRCLQIQRAVRRSARHPNFTGLEAMLSSALDETGGVVTSKFDEFVAKEQKQQAEIMKQHRLWNDEQEHDTKYDGDKQEGDAPGGGDRGRGRGRGKT